MGARHFAELRCWQLANELKREVYAFTAIEPARRDRDFCDDIRASARSAPANIAEGFGRHTHPEFARFLSIAHASLVETENHLGDALDCKYLSPSEWQRLTNLAKEAQRATAGLRTYLRATRMPKRRRSPVHGLEERDSSD
jgi:four helix bundle protein